MAIQLSERDYLIFRLIKEHHVLLEKQIAWFISLDEKPVLIRDRLRKLFYLDYLLCERHTGKLPWWTTPTKPLAYMLSPMTRQMLNASDTAYALSDGETQRHLLEVANLRMLLLQDQKEGLIANCTWESSRKAQFDEAGYDAIVSFKQNEISHHIGIINNPPGGVSGALRAVNQALEEKAIHNVWIISADDSFQRSLQQGLASTAIAGRVAFATHQEIYKTGAIKANWQSTNGQALAAIGSVTDNQLTWPGHLTAAPAV